MSITSFLRQLSAGDNVKDFAHASRTFVDGNMRLSPKSSFLYHVALELTNPILPIDRLIEAGMMAKNVNLPKFTIDNKPQNAYNRTVLVQTKVKYDPVTITFHDDMADVVRDLWVEYYNYYYRDALYSESIYNAPHLYQGTRPTADWGYKPDSGVPFFRTIRIYQMYQKRFTEYVLINPIITSMQHGTQQAGSSDPVETTMTVAYESVKYYTGTVSTNTIRGFGDFHYDKSPSPIAPGNNVVSNVLGTVSNVARDLSGNGSNQSILNNAFASTTPTANNFTNPATASGILDAVSNPNPNSTVYFPNIDNYGI